MEENKIVIRHLKTSCFNFDWPRDSDEKTRLKNKIKKLLS